MVRVDTHIVLLEVVVVFAVLNGPELVVCLQVWPAPQTAVNDMREALSVGHLQSPVQVPRNGHAPESAKRTQHTSR